MEAGRSVADSDNMVREFSCQLILKKTIFTFGHWNTSKAFYTISHRLLVYTLQFCGIYVASLGFLLPAILSRSGRSVLSDWLSRLSCSLPIRGRGAAITVSHLLLPSQSLTAASIARRRVAVASHRYRSPLQTSTVCPRSLHLLIPGLG